MAWTAPKTMGNEPTLYTDWNTHVRDNLLETAPAKVTTAGDIVYATGANALARLGIGTANQVLRVNSGATAPEWGPGGLLVYDYITQIATAAAGAENNLWSYSVPGGTLGTTGGLHLDAVFSIAGSAGSETYRLYFYYGTGVITLLNITGTYGRIDVLLSADILGIGATNSQRLVAFPTMNGTAASVPGDRLIVTATIAIDSTVAQTAKLTSNSTTTGTCYRAMLTGSPAV